ncbi:Tetratricopeptide repeat protein [Candidatus Koribacter versatilis Ellin345]|uniref:Tetratricopeptide repeat protein n=1 Tax=Koribacter versatilis (strain Ellin345) TaxID=204669 RepID=Q1IJU8_KORVE|nr:tetratricopeptide repeat protein [Candidatus Koribacter versatilis]ABF42852.1 Tetratricopeptide repeat protein [Candidatus Koribacter versatilis Ellin345]
MGAVLGFFSRIAISSAVITALLIPAAAQQNSKATLDTSEALFAIMAAANNCGYNDEVSSSAPVRAKIRGEVDSALANNPKAAQAEKEVCAFYRDHQQSDAPRTISSYLSLGILASDPPKFLTKVPESDLPPDAAYALGILSPLGRMYEEAGLHQVWLKHKPEYDALIQRYHQPMHDMIDTTDRYLRIQVSGYVGRSYMIYLEPLIGPSLANSRNYGNEYYFVVSPSGANLKMHEIRHTYLHFILDPMAFKRGSDMRRIMPLLASVQNSPLSDAYKQDPTLLTTESLIRAIEARTLPFEKGNDKREDAVLEAESEGLVLTQYFYDRLAEFEKGDTGLEAAYGEWLHFLDLDHEKKRASKITFSQHAAPEVMQASILHKETLLTMGEQALIKGDLDAAEQSANKVLEGKDEDAAKAYFLLARIYTMRGEMESAKSYFYLAIDRGTDARTRAWSHIYLGRIFDLQEKRDEALKQYNAALAENDTKPDTNAAAQRGMKAPYTKPVKQSQAQ